MGAPTNDQFCLKWNNYQHSLTSAFRRLLEDEDFVDVTLSAEGQNLRAHKVVLGACSSYFRDLLRGIAAWQHPVLLLRDVKFTELQSILEFVYLGEVNVEQECLEGFLKTAELLKIKGLTDGIQQDKNQNFTKDLASGFTRGNIVKRQLSAVTDEILNSDPLPSNNNPPAKRIRGDLGGLASLARVTASDCAELSGDDIENEEFSEEHIIVAGDPVTNEDIEFEEFEEFTETTNGKLFQSGSDKEFLGPLHKRCPHCQMVMLKKNLSRHIRDQHTVDRPRSNCPICQKSYKTPDWLKDHIRRGHGYTKEDTDDLLAKLSSGKNDFIDMNVSRQNGIEAI